MGLPSIWVLAAVSLGGSLMGVVGMLIFIPVVSVIYALFREVVYLKLKQREITPEEVEKVLEERRKCWRPREPKYKSGVLRLFSEHAASPMKGAYLEFKERNSR